MSKPKPFYRSGGISTWKVRDGVHLTADYVKSHKQVLWTLKVKMNPEFGATDLMIDLTRDSVRKIFDARFFGTTILSLV